MSRLSIDQKTIKELLTDKRSDFLIPDYQRPYAWSEDECSTLWDDLFTFAIPNGDCEAFDTSSEYFLGPIVTFKNENEKLEIIDGQQRLTTIMLLLRAFYDKFGSMKDERSVDTRKNIAACVWKTDEFDEPDMDQLKIESEVASDEDREQFLQILKDGKVDNNSSNYAKNFQFFQSKIAELVNEWPTYTVYLARRILNNVILLPIEAESQGTALRIFSTLNDRGLPLSDADIFKSQFYKYYSDKGEKDSFVERWKTLEEGAKDLSRPKQGTPMNELFTRYMYYLRAKMGIRDTTTQALRDFYSRDSYALLKTDKTLQDLEILLDFWQSVDNQIGFSEKVLKRLFVLSYAPNSMWTYLVSVWYLANKDANGHIDEDAFHEFLNLITGFIFAYAIERPGVNALRTPVYPEMINIVEHRPVTFESHLFDREGISSLFRSYQFNNGRPVTKSMLVWWAFNDPEQPLLDSDTKLEIEHIYARKRNDVSPLQSRNYLEALGNKAILEQKVNIRAADYRFEDKKAFYLGLNTDKNKSRSGTSVKELRDMASSMDDFTEEDIVERTDEIINTFVEYLGEVGLLRD